MAPPSKPAPLPRTATHVVELFASTAPEDVKLALMSAEAVAVNVTGVMVFPLISRARKVSPVFQPALMPGESGYPSSYTILVRYSGSVAVALMLTSAPVTGTISSRVHAEIRESEVIRISKCVVNLIL